MVLPMAVHTSALRIPLSVRNLHSTSGRFWWSYPGWWLEDHKSRRWPRTEEERKAAAARYGLKEGDYTPVKEDYMGGIGDYPDLGEINYGVKDPYEDWSMDKYRRNYGEPVPWNFNINSPDKYTWTHIEQEHVKRPAFWRRYFGYIGGLFLFLYFCYEFPIRLVVPLKPKQYPYDYNYAYPTFDPKLFPLMNYTFEPADEGSSSSGSSHGHH